MPDFRAPRDIVINGRFLSQRLSGVQRYAREIVLALDRLIVRDKAIRGRRRWQLAVPIGRDTFYRPEASEVVEVGKRSGHLWEQLDLCRFSRNSLLINLANSGPILHRHSVVVIHDAAPFRTPRNFSARYRIFHRLLGRLLAKSAHLGTVSEFSRKELSEVLHVPQAQIFVAYNGCDHLDNRTRSTDITARLGIAHRPYFLFVGSPTFNKSLDVALEAFRNIERRGVRFVIAGALNSSVFGGASAGEMPEVIVASTLSDADIAGLYADAAALIFPSRYEGFGIPPLEAMVFGCPVIASDIPALREICGDAAAFFPPGDAAALSVLMDRRLDDRDIDGHRAEASARTRRFTWDKAARQLADAVLSSE